MRYDNGYRCSECPAKCAIMTNGEWDIDFLNGRLCDCSKWTKIENSKGGWNNNKSGGMR